MTPRLHRRRLTMLCAAPVAIAALAGCGVTEDSEPRDLPIQNVAQRNEVSGDEATGFNRIYLIAQDEEQVRLRSVARGVDATPAALLDSLVAGPNTDELDAGLFSAIPLELEILSTQTVGSVLTVDMNDALSALIPETLTEALAQIVATTTELDVVQRVRLRVNGQNQTWLTGDGQLSAKPLSIYDYPNLVESTQPALPSLPST